MEKENPINEFASKNAKKMIDKLIQLLAYQEKVNISYICKLNERKEGE